MDSGIYVCSLIQSHSALLPKIIKVKNTQNYTNSKVNGCFFTKCYLGELHVVCGSNGRAEKTQGFGGWNGALEVYFTDREMTC